MDPRVRRKRPDGPIRFRSNFNNTILDVMKGRGWVQTDSEIEWDFQWAERDWVYADIDTMHLEPWQKLNHFRNGRELCRKVSSMRKLQLHPGGAEGGWARGKATTDTCTHALPEEQIAVAGPASLCTCLRAPVDAYISTPASNPSVLPPAGQPVQEHQASETRVREGGECGDGCALRLHAHHVRPAR